MIQRFFKATRNILFAITLMMMNLSLEDLKAQIHPTGYGNDSTTIENILIIFDASNSMNETIHGIKKLDMAKRAVAKTLSSVPGNVRIGLRIYGHKMNPLAALADDGCTQTELVIPISPNSAYSITNMIHTIRAKGSTPLSYSIKTAVQNDFYATPGKKRIIVISDGVDTCYGNPCSYAVDVVRKGIDLKIDVVGFGLEEADAISQLKCIALSTGGKFYKADTEAHLIQSLNSALKADTEVTGRILNIK